MIESNVNKVARLTASYMLSTPQSVNPSRNLIMASSSISDETIYAQLQCSSGYVTSGCPVTECKYGKWSHTAPHCRGRYQLREYSSKKHSTAR